MGRSNKNTLKETLSKASYMAGPVDGLPEGWKVETKTYESGNHAGNKYKYYTDPGTGYVFRSKKDALRYVKTGVLGKYAFKPKERRTNNVKEGDVTTSNCHQSTGKCSNSDELANNKPVFAGQCSKSDEAVNDEPKLDAVVSKPDEAVNGESAVESSAIGGGDMELSRPFLLKKKSSKKRKGKKATFAQVESQSAENGVEEHKRRKTQVGSKKRKKLELDTPRRVSKRLAGIAAEVVAVMKRPSRTPQVDAVGPPPEAMVAVNSTGPDAKLASEMKRPNVTPHVEAEKQPPEPKLAVNSTGTDGELASDLEGPATTQAASVEPPSGAIGQPPEAMVAVNSTGPDAKLASEMKRPDVTPHVEAEKQPPDAKLAVNSTGTDGELASDLEGPDTTQAVLVEPPSGAKLAVNSTGTNGELASDLEGHDTTPAASVEPPSGAILAVSHTSVDSAHLVSAQFYQFEPVKAGNCAADPPTDEIHLKQVGSQVITKEVTATTWASGGEGYPEQRTSDTRREEQTIQSQPLLDHFSPGEFDIMTQADGNLEDPLEFPFTEWPDLCLEFAYKTPAASVEPPSGAMLAASHTSVDSARLVSAQIYQFEPAKAGNWAADPLTDEIHLKQVGSQVITKAVAATTWASGGEGYPEQGVSDSRREEQTIQSQPLLDHVTPGEFNSKTQADGNLKDPLELPFVEWPDPCLAFVYKTPDAGKGGTISNPKPMSDPQVIPKEVTATTWASGGEGYPELGTSDTRREEQTIESQPLLDNATPGEFDIKTQADGNLEDLLKLPFAEWPDPCLEFVYKTLDAGKVGTTSNTKPMSDPQVITKEVTAATWASGGEGYPELGTYDTRREEQTIQSQPLLDHVSPGEFDIKTQADGNLEDPLELPFAEWPDPCLEFAYKTLDAGEVGTVSNTNPLSDPCIEFAYKILTGAIPVEYNTSTACPDVIPMSDPCTEFAYKNLPGATSVENTQPGTFTDALPPSDACIEFDYRTLTGGVPMETPAIVENNQAVPVPGSIPLSDPRLEFAYTTPIGAIPLEESWAVQGYFQQQSSAQTQSDNLVDGSFGSVVKPTSLNKLQNECRSSPEGKFTFLQQ